MTTLKHLTVWTTTNCRKFLEMGIPDHLNCLLRNLYAGQEATVRTRHGTTDCLKLGKEYIKAIYCYPAYWTNVQGASCEMSGWMNHKLESRLLGELSTISDMQMIPLNGKKWRGTKEPLDAGERGEWKSWLTTQHSKKLRSLHQDSSLHGKLMGEKWKQWQILFWGAGLQNHCGWWLQLWY